MRQSIPFQAVRELLEELGFTERIGRDSHLIFEHASGAVVFFHHYQPTDALSGTDLVSLPYYLDMRGLLERNSFEEWSRSVAV